MPRVFMCDSNRHLFEMPTTLQTTAPHKVPPNGQSKLGQETFKQRMVVGPFHRTPRMGPPTSQYICIPIKVLLDYSNAESWLGSFYTITIRCLDDDLELYQLLDLDAEGIDNPDSHVEDVLAE